MFGLPCVRMGTESLRLPKGRTIHVRKCVAEFEIYSGEHLVDTYGGKPVLDWCGEPVFAELAILRAVVEAGWDGVWVDTFGHRAFRVGMRDQPAVELPNEQQVIYAAIAARSSMPGGCWDVFAWKDGDVLFAESKRSKRDSLRANQLHWLEAALAVGLGARSFLLVEWNTA